MATVLQHELDHLEGVLYVDKIRDMSLLATIADYQKYWAEKDVPAPGC